MANWKKDPQAKVDFMVKWGDWLTGPDPDETIEDEITASAWRVVDCDDVEIAWPDAGVTKVSDTHTETNTVIWLEGGTAGETYRLVNRITTSGGRINEKTSTLLVAER